MLITVLFIIAKATQTPNTVEVYEFYRTPTQWDTGRLLKDDID